MPKYVGRRIVPKHGGIWDKTKEYEELIIVLCQAGDLNSVHREPAAKNYVRPGSMKLTTQTEQFLNKRVDRVAKSDSSSGAAAGAAAAHHHSSSSSGSTTHTSSSGTTHGGSSGKF